MSEREVLASDNPAIGRTEDRQLAERAAARDADAWSALFDLHYTRVYAFLRYRLSGAAEAEDIAAQVFEVAYSRANTFDYRGVPIEAWLTGIARNLVRDHIKKIGRRGYTETLEDAPEPAQDDTATAVDLKNDLQSALHALTEDQQEVIIHRFISDLSVTETATLMNRSEDATKNLQRRALAAMQRALQSVGYERHTP